MSLKTLSLAVVLASALAAPALAQSSTGTGSGSITIVRPLTVKNDASLEFGAVIRPNSGNGEVAVDVAGARSFTGGLAGLSTGATPHAAQFTVEGEGGQTVSVQVPQSFDLVNGSNRLQVLTTNNLPASGQTTLSNSLGSQGSANFKVGGKVGVSNGTLPGVYTGTFIVTAAYN